MCATRSSARCTKTLAVPPGADMGGAVLKAPVVASSGRRLRKSTKRRRLSQFECRHSLGTDERFFRRRRIFSRGCLLRMMQ